MWLRVAEAISRRVSELKAREAASRRVGPSPVAVNCRVCGKPIAAGEEAVLVRAEEPDDTGREVWVPVVHPSCAATQERW